MFITPDDLLLLQIIFAFTVLIHLVYISFLSGGSIISLLLFLGERGRATKVTLNPFRGKFAKEIVEITAMKWSAALILGIAPLLSIGIIYHVLLFDARIFTLQLWFALIALVALGILLIFSYRRMLTKNSGNSLIAITTGGSGILILLVTSFLLITSYTLILFPEEWGSIFYIYQIGYFYYGIPRFISFLVGAIALTGAGILFFFFGWKESSVFSESNKEYKNYVKKIGISMVLIGSLLFPPARLLSLIFVPETGLSISIFVFAGVIVILLMAITLMAYSMLNNAQRNFSTLIAIIMLGVFCITVVSDHLSQHNSTKNIMRVLLAKADIAIKEKEEARRQQLSATLKQLAVSGETIFKERCALCHSFTEKIIGPPYIQTIPNYFNNLEGLKSFIRNPVKKNPGYPPMPQLGLKDYEIEAVARYEMAEVQKLLKR